MKIESGETINGGITIGKLSDDNEIDPTDIDSRERVGCTVCRGREVLSDPKRWVRPILEFSSKGADDGAVADAAVCRSMPLPATLRS